MKKIDMIMWLILALALNGLIIYACIDFQNWALMIAFVMGHFSQQAINAFHHERRELKEQHSEAPHDNR
jgi:hypothetical protein